LEQPSYVELPDENLAARVNITLHHPYSRELFTKVLEQDWRDLKHLFREIVHRRGRAGAAFNLTFVDRESRLVFRSGLLNEEETSSALDQVGHLTGIINRMKSDNSTEPLGLVECSFDRKSDRWQDFHGFALSSQKRAYSFDDANFKWVGLGESAGELRSKSADYKADGGKLVRVRLTEQDGLVKTVELSGDFFLLPEENLERLEETLIGSRLQSSELQSLIYRFFETTRTRGLGVKPEDFVKALVLASESPDQ
jgi:lipoate---protein ligase